MTGEPASSPLPPAPAREPAGSPEPPHSAREAASLLAISVVLEGLVLLIPEGGAGSLGAALRPTLHVLAWMAPAYFAVERRGRDPLVAHALLVRPQRTASTLGLALLTLPLYAVAFVLRANRGIPQALPPLAPALERFLRDLPFAALPEEYFFRGALQPSILPRRPYAGIALASVAFAVAHVLFDPAHSPARLLVFFPSLVFGWLRLRTGSLAPGIFFHALCNGVEELLRSTGVKNAAQPPRAW